MKPQIILFDLDDTLIHCNRYFFETIDRFASRLQHYVREHKPDHELSPQSIQDKQLELDMVGVHQFGFVKERFPKSLIETYHYYRDLAGLPMDSSFEDELWQLGMGVYEQQYEPYPHALETLDILQQDGHELHLYTGGDVSVQTDKVEQLGLRRYFEDRIYITPHKTTRFMNDVIVERGMERNRTWMIGNSARTDVVPALQNGIHAIYIPIEQEWQFNQIEITDSPAGAFLTLDSIKQVPSAIQEFQSFV